MEELEVATKVSGAMALFIEMWEHKMIPTERKHSVIIPICKKKDKLDCSNYKGTSLL